MNSQGGKIIVVDDLADWREMLQGLLSEAGYTVKVASDSTEAMDLLSQEPYHVAIVDLRLDESDEANQEGLALAERMKDYLPELAIIILTGYAEIRVVKSALQPRENGSSIAFSFLEKNEFSKLLPSIEIAFTHAAKINPQLDIRLASTLNWSKLQNDIACLRSLNPNLARLEIIDLLQRLFYQAQHIDVKATNIGHKDRAIVLVNPTIGNRPQIDIVVKFNQPKQAERESRNYDNYVMHHVGGPKRTQRLDFRATAKLGGIAYSFIGTEEIEFQRFGELYPLKEVDNLKKIFNNLFDETCYTWYIKTLSPNKFPQSLSACYQEWLGLKSPELLVSLKEIVQRANVSNLSFIDPRHPDQSDILFEEQFRLTNPLPLARTTMEYNGPFCFNHGDLHENNILVDGRNQTWLIDFYQTDSGHPARDFAMIEAAIKFHLQKSDCSPMILYDWERSLVQVKSLDKKPKLNVSLQNDAEIIKATELILHVRSLLLQILQGMGVTDYQIALKDYQIALYFHALKGMTLLHKFSKRQRLHALISASLLAKLLQSESKVPPDKKPITNPPLDAQDKLVASASIIEVRGNQASVIVSEAEITLNNYDVFVCYNRVDKPMVIEIVERLKKRRISPWLGEWEIRPGTLKQKALEEQIKNAKTVAIFIGPKGASPWQDMEQMAIIQQFTERGNPVIPVILSEVEGEPKLPTWLSLLHPVDFRKPNPDPFEQLVWGITGSRNP